MEPVGVEVYRDVFVMCYRAGDPTSPGGYIDRHSVSAAGWCYGAIFIEESTREVWGLGREIDLHYKMAVLGAARAGLVDKRTADRIAVTQDFGRIGRA